MRADASAAAIASAPLLPAGAAGALPGLLGRVAGDQPEADGDAGVERGEQHARARLGADVLEVRRLAADHAAERGDRRVAPAARRLAREQAELERARRGDDVDLGAARPRGRRARRRAGAG